MANHYHSGRWLAISAGIASTAGALAILLADPIASGIWKLDHFLLPVIVAITIAAGHLVGSALRVRKILASAGFAVIFTFGTLLTVYSSVGSQKSASGDRALNVEAHNAAIKAKSADIVTEKHNLAVAVDMLANVRGQHLAESKQGGCKAKCQGIERSMTVYQASIVGHEANIKRLEVELSSLGGEKVARPKAAAFAEAAAVFGFDRARVETAVTILEPFAYGLLMEMTAIVAFGFAFAGNRRLAAPATVAEADVSRATGGNRQPRPQPPKPGNRRPVDVRTVASRAAAEADVIQLVSRGERLPSQDTLARRWGVHKATASKWLADFEQRGLILREWDGRHKQVAAVA